MNLIAGGAVATALAWTGVPRLVAETDLLPATDVVHEIRQGRAVANRELTDVINRSALAARLDPHRRAERGSWRLLQVGDAPNPAARRDAVEDLGRGLTAAPMDGEDWSYLARALQDAGARIDLQIKALRMAFLLGPYRLTYVRWRLGTALALDDYLDDDLRARVSRQIELLWEVKALQPILVDLADDATGRAWLERVFADRSAVLRQIRFTQAFVAADRLGREDIDP